MPWLVVLLCVGVDLEGFWVMCGLEIEKGLVGYFLFASSIEYVIFGGAATASSLGPVT